MSPRGYSRAIVLFHESVKLYEEVVKKTVSSGGCQFTGWSSFSLMF